MGPMKLYFDFRDLFRAPRLGLSGKKIMVFTVGLVVGWLVYWILTYFAYATAGYSFQAMWDRYGLYPCLFGHPAPWYSWIIYAIGVLFWFYSINIACTMVSRITYKQLKGDEFYSSGDAWKFLKKHWYPVIFTWISLVAIIVVFLIGAVIFALFGKIPYVGEFLFAVPYLMYFFGSVFTLYTAVVLVVSFLYTPAIVAAYEEDTMGAVFQSYSITWGHPWRVVLYHLLLFPLVGIGLAVFKYFWVAGYNLINIVFGQGWLMGDKLSHIVGWATRYVVPGTQNCAAASCCSPATAATHNSLTCYLSLSPGTSLSGTETVAGVILAVFLFALFASVVAYGLSVLSVGETLMFVIFKKKGDDDNLLERKDEEELEEEEEDEDEDLNLDDEEEDTDSADGEDADETEASSDDDESPEDSSDKAESSSDSDQ